MYFKTILSVLFLSVLLMACGDKANNSKSTEDDPKETMETKAGETPETNETERRAGELAPINGEAEPVKKVESNDNILSNTSTLTPATPPGMNPPHGQPGHDCKIPVGQPLDGSTLNNTNTQAQTINLNNAGPRIQQTPQPKPQGTVTQTAPGMNPPHGQPGHDCKIPVGSPLNSGK